MWKLAFIIVSLQMYLIKVLQKCSLSSPLPNMYMNFFQTAEFDWFSSEAIRGMKLKLYRNVHNMCLYKKNVFFIAFAHVHLSLWQLNVSIDLKWEI